MERTVDLQGRMINGRSAADGCASGGSEECALVRAAQGGDAQAFGCLYTRYAKMVHGILLARVPVAEVDDLVQDVFLRAFPRVKSLRDLARFGGWLAAIARNRANDYHRKSRSNGEAREQGSEEIAEAPDPRGSEELRGEVVLDLIGTLPEAYRETLVLRLVEGMSGPEIAERTGLTAGSVRVNLHRGMQQLREKLSGIGDCARDSARRGKVSGGWRFAMRKRNAP